MTVIKTGAYVVGYWLLSFLTTYLSFSLLFLSFELCANSRTKDADTTIGEPAEIWTKNVHSRYSRSLLPLLCRVSPKTGELVVTVSV